MGFPYVAMAPQSSLSTSQTSMMKALCSCQVRQLQCLRYIAKSVGTVIVVITGMYWVRSQEFTCIVEYVVSTAAITAVVSYWLRSLEHSLWDSQSWKKWHSCFMHVTYIVGMNACNMYGTSLGCRPSHPLLKQKCRSRWVVSFPGPSNPSVDHSSISHWEGGSGDLTGDNADLWNVNKVNHLLVT